MKRRLVGLSIFMLFLFSLPAHAGAPLDTVQTNVNKVLEVLRDPALKAAVGQGDQKGETSADL